MADGQISHLFESGGISRKNLKEKKKFAKELKAKLHGLRRPGT
jgi:hypothetical protein